MKDYVIRATGANGQIRAFVGITTNMVEEARRLHETSKVATAALGRTLTATSMMGLMMKNKGDKLSVIIKGGGPIGTILTTSDVNGTVKGYVSNPKVEVPDYENGKLNVAAAVGTNGVVKVIKDLGLREPYNGAYPLVSGEIAEDFTHYFAVSEQTPSVVALGVLTTEQHVECAGGLIVQLMPDATEESISQLEKNIQNLKSITTMLSEGKTPEDMLNIVLEGLQPRILDKIDVSKVKNKELSKLRREKIGFIFQDYNLLDNMTLMNNIALPLALGKKKSKEIEDKVINIAKKFGLENHLDKYPYQLSGGQKQRGAAARSLITNPAVIFADEPTGALDSKSAYELLDSLEKVNRENNATIIMITHDPLTASYANEVYMINDGNIKCKLNKGNSRKEFYSKIIDMLASMGGEI